MNIDINSLDSSFLPDVFFTKILLESSDTPQDKSPQSGGRRNLPTPLKYKKNSINKEKALSITLSLSIMDHIDENGITSWFYNEDLTKYLKIKIIQSRSMKITRKLMNSDFRCLNDEKFTNLFEEQEITVKKDFNQDITDFISFDTAQNKRIFNIDYTLSFIIDDLEPPHLSYFAFCYFDLRSLVQDYQMEFLLPNNSSNYVRGSVSGEKVVAKSELQLETFSFFREDGTIWTGAVHKMKDGRWMSGAQHTAESIYLIRQKLSNTKIQDFREIDNLKLMDFDLTPAQNIFATFEQGLTGTQQRVIQNPPEVYFSPAFLSYGTDGGSKFLFQLDYDRIIRDKTQFGSIIDQSSNSESLAEIYKNSRITLLKIVRRRVKFGTGSNRIGSPVFGQIIVDPREPVITVALSSDMADNRLKTIETRRGSIKELSLLSPKDKFRTFTVTDSLAPRITDGYYQYGIEIEIADGTVPFLNKQLRRLIAIKDEINLYYSIASSPGYYNNASQRFTKKLLKYYKNSSPDELPWIKGVSIFMDVLTTLTSINNPKSIGKRLFAFLNPYSGSLEGIHAFLNLIQMLETKLIFILGPRVLIQTPGNQSKRMVESKLKQSVITINQFFNQTWDSNERADLGLDYLNLPDASDGIGIKGVTYDNFRERIQQENSFYWTSPDLLVVEQSLGTAQLAGVSGDVSPILNLSTVEYSYLSPGTIYGGNGFILNTADMGQAAYNVEAYSAMTNTLIAQSTAQWTNAYAQEATITTGMPTVGSNALDNILSQLNISVVPTIGATQFQLVPIQQLNPSMLPVGEILGENDLEAQADLYSVGPYDCIEKLEDTTQEVDSRKKLPIGTVFVQNLALNGQLNNKKGRIQAFKSPFMSPEKKNISNFNLNTSHNLLDKLRSSPLTEADFDKVPNQIRSLMVGSSNVVMNRWPDMDLDVIQDVETSELYRYNYDMLAQVEVLMSYNTNGDGVNLMMSPNFVLLRSEHLSSLTKNQVVLCRLRKYTNEILGVGVSEGIDIKYFDEYFLISKSSGALNNNKATRRRSPNATTSNMPRKSIGYAIAGMLKAENKKTRSTPPSFQSNMIINQKLKTKLDII